jgi:ribosomal protein L24
MIEQEITRLVNQSEKKGRFIIQELDDEKNVLEKSHVWPNNVEKYFSKKTKHSSICNNYKIIHLLHNQSENPNLNQNFSTFIFEDNSKNWIDFDLIWTKFSQFHCDVSENNMEKIFNYTYLKSDDENNSSYFNDSLNINNNGDVDINQKLLLSNNVITLGEKAKKPVNPSNDNLTNVQSTRDISHSNIADIGMLSNITSTHFKNLHNEINFNFNGNQNSNDNNYINSYCNNNANVNNITNVNGISASCNGEPNNLNKTVKNEPNCYAARENKTASGYICAHLLKDKKNEEIIDIEKYQKYEKIENQPDESKLNFTADYLNKEDCNKIKLLGASETKTDQILNFNFENKNNKMEANETNINKGLNCNTLILQEILSSDANKNNPENEFNKIDESNSNNKQENSNLNKNDLAPQDLVNSSTLNDKNQSESKSAHKKQKLKSPSKMKNLEINFCENRIIISPAFSPINSDYLHKFDKINLDLNSLVNENNKKINDYNLKSGDRLIFLEDYFKEEKNNNSKKRQKRIFSEFKPNRNFENKFFYNLKISNVNNFCFIPEKKKIIHNINMRKKKTAKAKKNSNLQISENIQIEISAVNKLDDDEKENTWDKKNEDKFDLEDKKNFL